MDNFMQLSLLSEGLFNYSINYLINNVITVTLAHCLCDVLAVKLLMFAFVCLTHRVRILKYNFF